MLIITEFAEYFKIIIEYSRDRRIRSFSSELFAAAVLEQEQPDDDDYCDYYVDADGVDFFFARAFWVEGFFVRGFVGEAAAREGD